MNDLTATYVRPGLQHNPNLTFIRNEIKNYRILALPGGTRSGKTYSTIQWLWANLARYNGVKYSIVRATFPSLKATVMEDFVEIGRSCGLYTPSNHHLTNNEYRHNGNLLDYFSAEDDEKVRGRKRNVLYMNEAPEIPWKIVEQLLWRTTDKIILDYNPSYPESWVYDNILPRKDCAFITTTFKDNPHLTKGQLDELEWMRVNDPDTYLVYGLGQRGELKGQVYKNWKSCKALEDGLASAYVIDFGFTNDPACIGEFRRHNRTMWGREHLYAKGMDNIDLGIALFCAGADGNSVLIADSADPKSIGELRNGWALDADYLLGKVQVMLTNFERAATHQPAQPHMLERLRLTIANPQILAALSLQLRAGYPVHQARKGPDSIDAGIQIVKQHEVLITDDSVNAWRESRLYRWAEDPRTGVLLNKPIDKDNHFMDVLRYYALAIGFIV